VVSGNDLGGPSPTDGTYLAQLSIPLSINAGVTLEQTLSETLVESSRYELTLDLDFGTLPNLTTEFLIELRAGSFSVASLENSQLNELVDSEAGLQEISLVYVTTDAPPDGNIGIHLSASGTAAAGMEFYIDNFQLTVTPIPEPRPLLLVLIGAACLVSVRAFRLFNGKAILNKLERRNG
jgi:hypothetical protein